MRWGFAQHAESVHAADDPFAKVMLPEAVDHDASRQRVGRIDQPVGQFQPAATLWRRPAAPAQPGQWAARYGIAEILVTAADVQPFVLPGAVGHRRRSQLWR